MKIPDLNISRYLDENEHQESHDRLVQTLGMVVPDQLQLILDASDGDTDASFLGFTAQYEALAKLIPLDRIVLDFGCCLAPQAWYFRQHAKYIGIDASVPTHRRFKFENTVHYQATIQEWLKDRAPFKRKTFAICQYVPDYAAQKLVRENFYDCFVYYP